MTTETMRQHAELYPAQYVVCEAYQDEITIDILTSPAVYRQAQEHMQNAYCSYVEEHYQSEVAVTDPLPSIIRMQKELGLEAYVTDDAIEVVDGEDRFWYYIAKIPEPKQETVS